MQHKPKKSLNNVQNPRWLMIFPRVFFLPNLLGTIRILQGNPTISPASVKGRDRISDWWFGTFLFFYIHRIGPHS